LAPQVRAQIKRLKPDIVMERYYNFSGAGVRAAQGEHIPVVLEVNAPMLDPTGSRKDIADRATLRWMTRMAHAQALGAKRIVTPLASTVPFIEVRPRIREIPWGANVELFDRTRLDAVRLDSLRAQINPGSKQVVVFLGSFRPWHGVREFLQVAQALAHARDGILFMMLGSGELLPNARATVQAAGLQDRILLPGALPYEDVPYYLALANVGVAPFNTTVHPPLQVGFYWSPLKVHEYMAMGLPVVTVDLPGLDQIARHEREGLLYSEGDLAGLRAAILRLIDDPALARQLGEAGRARVVEKFSWQRHAELLELVLEECLKE
jgi:glycosyltransferase involved in cell wall biosynthesis